MSGSIISEHEQSPRAKPTSSRRSQKRREESAGMSTEAAAATAAGAAEEAARLKQHLVARIVAEKFASDDVTRVLKRISTKATTKGDSVHVALLHLFLQHGRLR